MLDFYFIVGIIAGGLSLTAYVIYIYATIYGKTKPNRATWWILTLVGFMVLISYYAGGARETIWVPLAYVIGPLIIAIASFKRGVGGWTTFDRWCLIGAGASVIVWFFTKSPITALIINLFIDFLGILPTIKKSYQQPITENATAWVLEETSSLINLFAVTPWVFAIYIYPVYLAIVNGVVAILLVYGFLRRRKLASVKSN